MAERRRSSKRRTVKVIIQKPETASDEFTPAEPDIPLSHDELAAALLGLEDIDEDEDEDDNAAAHYDPEPEPVFFAALANQGPDPGIKKKRTVSVVGHLSQMSSRTGASR